MDDRLVNSSSTEARNLLVHAEESAARGDAEIVRFAVLAAFDFIRKNVAFFCIGFVYAQDGAIADLVHDGVARPAGHIRKLDLFAGHVAVRSYVEARFCVVGCREADIEIRAIFVKILVNLCEFAAVQLRGDGLLHSIRRFGQGDLPAQNRAVIGHGKVFFLAVLAGAFDIV